MALGTVGRINIAALRRLLEAVPRGNGVVIGMHQDRRKDK